MNTLKATMITAMTLAIAVELIKKTNDTRVHHPLKDKRGTISDSMRERAMQTAEEEREEQERDRVIARARSE